MLENNKELNIQKNQSNILEDIEIIIEDSDET